MYKNNLEEPYGLVCIYFDDDNRQFFIGRSNMNHIIIKDNSISRRHCMIHVKNNKIYIKDISSKFGTQKNQEKINFPNLY